MTKLGTLDLGELSDALRRRGLDGWLLYDFHGLNPLVSRTLPVTGMITRRVFVWLPAVGPPHLVVHNIDRPAFGEFPGEVEVYTTWQQLQQRLATIVRGRRIAMETSPENAVPYMDRVPAGVVELLTRLGATLVPSDPLVTQFAAKWSPAERDDHRRVAETIAEIARLTLTRVIGEVGEATEAGVQRQVLEAMHAAGLETEEPPIVAFGAHAADPHYEPKESASLTLEPDQVVLLDLWGKRSPTTVWADQTWMAFSGAVAPDAVVAVWEAVRDARDAVVRHLQEEMSRRHVITGAQLDRIARSLIQERGYGDAFVHRTGHSIDMDLHGSGPHLDDFETHDVRELFPGVGFSVEPGVYLEGRFGVRSEINVILDAAGPEVTPAQPQRDLILVQ